MKKVWKSDIAITFLRTLALSFFAWMIVQFATQPCRVVTQRSQTTGYRLCSTGKYVSCAIQLPREVNQHSPFVGYHWKNCACPHFVQQELKRQDFENKMLQLTDWSLMYFCDAASTAATAWTVDKSPGNWCSCKIYNSKDHLFNRTLDAATLPVIFISVNPGL